VLYRIIIKLGDSRDDSYISEPILELEGPFPSLILLLCSVCPLDSLVPCIFCLLYWPSSLLLLMLCHEKSDIIKLCSVPYSA